MSFNSSEGGGSEQLSKALFLNKKKFKGIRRRKWGKWVSEIRVPGTSSRLWLGSYSTAEAASAAHEVASFYLRSSSSNSLEAECGDQGFKFNFPDLLRRGNAGDLSPRSVQKAASDAGMAVDAAHRVFVQQSESIVNESCDNEWCFGAECSCIGGSGSYDGGSCRGEDLNISIYDYL